MNGRASSVLVGATAVLIAPHNPSRRVLFIAVGNTANSASVMLKDRTPPTVTDGFPLAFSSGVLRLDGDIATHEWWAIRLNAADCQVGVIQGFDHSPEAVAVNSGEAFPP